MERASEEPISVSNCLELLGYNELTTSQEEMGDSCNKILSHQKRKNMKGKKMAEQERRKKLDDEVTKLAARLIRSPIYAKKPTLKKCLLLALAYIKNLKIDSNNLEAERYWLIQENKELVGRLTELEVQYAVHSTTKLWEEGLPKLCTNTERDAVAEDAPVDKRVQAIHFNNSVENVRKLKMQLHAEFRRRNPVDVVQEKMEIGMWCSDGDCAGAPHRIHGYVWQSIISDSSVTEPESVQEDDDGRWLEDVPKMKDKVCPVKNVTPSCDCSMNELCNCTVGKSKTASKRKYDDSPAKMKKIQTRDSSAKKKMKEMKKKKKKEKDINSKPRRSPSTLRHTKKYVAETKNMVNTGSKLIVDESGKVIGLDSSDSVLSGKKLYVLQLGNKQGETSEASSDLNLNMVPLTPGNAVLVYQPKTSVESGVVPRSTSSQAPALHVRPLYAPISLTTNGVDSSPVPGQAKPKLVYVSSSPGPSQPTEARHKPLTVPGSISLDPCKRSGEGYFVLVPASSSSEFAQTTLVKGNNQNGPGSVSAQSQDPCKGIRQEVFTTSPKASGIGYHHPPLMNNKSYTVPGSVSAQDVNPFIGVRQEHFAMEPVAPNKYVGHQQTTVMNSKLYGAPTAVSVLGMNPNSGNVQEHSRSVPVTASASLRYHHTNVMTNKPCAASGSVSALGLVPSNRCGQEYFTMAPVASSVGYHNHQHHSVMTNKPCTAPGSESALGSDPMKGIQQMCFSIPPVASSIEHHHGVVKGKPDASPGYVSAPRLDSAKKRGQERFTAAPVVPGVPHSTVMYNEPYTALRPASAVGPDPAPGNGQQRFTKVSVASSKHIGHHHTAMMKEKNYTAPNQEWGHKRFSTVSVSPNVGHYQTTQMKDKSFADPRSVDKQDLGSSKGKGQEHLLMSHVYPAITDLISKELNNEPSALPGSISAQNQEPCKGIGQEQFSMSHLYPAITDLISKELNHKPSALPGSIRAQSQEPCKGIRQEPFTTAPVAFSLGYHNPTVKNNKSCTVPGSVSPPVVNRSIVVGQEHFRKVPVASRAGHLPPKVMSNRPYAVPGYISTQGLDPSKGIRQGDFTIVPVDPSVQNLLPTTIKNKPFSAPGSVSAQGVDPNRGNRIELFRTNPENVIPSVGYNQARKMKDNSWPALQSSSTLIMEPYRGCGQAHVRTVPSCADVAQSVPKVSTHKQCASGSVRSGNLDAGNASLPSNVGDHHPTRTKLISQVISGDVNQINVHANSSAVKPQTNANVSSPVASAESPKAPADADVFVEVSEGSSAISCMLCDKPFGSVKELQAHLIDSHTN